MLNISGSSQWQESCRNREFRSFYRYAAVGTCPKRRVWPPYRRGSREVEPLSRGGFYNAFHGPPPDGGASRRWDGVVVVLVVPDPVGGAGRTRPLRGRVVTIGIPVQTRSVDAGVSYLINGFGVSRSRFREIHQKSRSAIKFGFFFRTYSFSRERRLRAMSSGRHVDLGRPLR